MMNSDPQSGDMPEKDDPEDFGFEDDSDPLAPTNDLPPGLQAQAEATATSKEPEDVVYNETEELREELNATKDKLLRALAEAENTRRRASKERDDAGSYAISAFARDLLTVADNLRRAIEATPEDALQDERIKNLFDGIEATERELLRALEKNHVTKIDPMDEVFDPNFHEVMFEAPVPDKQAGTVFQVMEVGYKLKDRLLRPARVGVAKGDGAGDEKPLEGEKPPSTTPGGNLSTEA